MYVWMDVCREADPKDSDNERMEVQNTCLVLSCLDLTHAMLCLMRYLVQ